MTIAAIHGGNTVQLHFTLTLANGETVENTRDKHKDPIRVSLGDAGIPQIFTQHIIGLPAVPGTYHVTIAPDQGFGMPNPKSMQEIPLKNFADAITLEPGTIVSFSGATNSTETFGIIHSIASDHALVDFNHPLAGETLSMTVEIFEIE